MIEKRITAPLLPSEIIWLIFTYADMATLASCSEACTHWYLLSVSQPFWVNELACFLEKLKNELEGMKDIDVPQLIDCAKEKGSAFHILGKLHKQEEKREKYQKRLSVLNEKQLDAKNRQKQNQYGYIIAADPLSGYFYVSFGEGKSPSFFGGIKQRFNKSRYKKMIEKIDEREEEIINHLKV